MKRVFALLAVFFLLTSVSALASGVLALPEQLTVIEAEAFRGDLSLTEVRLPDGCIRIGASAFGDCANLTWVVIPPSVRTIGTNAFDGCPNVTLKCATGSAAAIYADANGIAWEPMDARPGDGAGEWYMAPVLNAVTAENGQVTLRWTSNGVADTYGVYELFDEVEALRARVTGTSATLYGVSAGTHTYVVRPLLSPDSSATAGERSNAMSATLSGGVDAPVITYADEDSAGKVTLRWTGTAASFSIQEQTEDGFAVMQTGLTGTEATLEGVGSGFHTYAVRAESEDGATALSELRKIWVCGIQPPPIAADELTLYPKQVLRLHPSYWLDDGITWSSSDDAVATVSKFGDVTGVAEGTAVITGTSRDGGQSTCTVTVVAAMPARQIGDFYISDSGSLYYLGKDKEVVIPANEGIWRTGTTFSNSDITSVVIPEGVTEISDSAFSGCASLVSVSLPKSLIRIGKNAFSGCTSLREVTLDNTRGLEVWQNAFNGCSALTKLTVGGRYVRLESQSFSDCDALSYVDIGGTDTILYRAFVDCDALSRLDFSSENGYFYGFSNCPALTEVNISGSGVKLYDSFSSDSTVPVALKVTGSGVKIGNFAFQNNSCPLTLEITGKDAVIDGSTFRKNKGLRSVKITGSNARISSWAFDVCTGLTAVELTGANLHIGEGLFHNCTSLARVTLANIGSTLPKNTFEGCTALTRVELPDGIQLIEKEAFKGCTALTRVDLPASLSQIGDSAFYGCAALSEAALPKSLRSIAANAFYGCAALLDSDFPATLRAIGTDAFNGCAGLRQLRLPDNLESIGSRAFAHCEGLETAEIAGRGLEIGSRAFDGCTRLKSVRFSGSGISLGVYALSDCTALTALELPACVQSVGADVISGCSSLSRLDLSCQGAELAQGCFRDCTGLQTVNIYCKGFSPTSYMFSGCESLQTLNVWGDDALFNYTSAFKDHCGAFVLNVYGENACFKSSSLGKYAKVKALNLYGNGAQIMTQAFIYSETLAAVNIAASDVNLGIGATSNNVIGSFYDCKALESVIVSGDNVVVPPYAFANLPVLATVQLGSGATISDYAFKNCAALSMLQLGEGATINRCAFSGCKALTDLEIGGSASIGNGAFMDCAGLPTLDLSAAAIDISAFGGCTGLSSVSITGTGSTIGSYAFSACESLARVLIGQGTRSINSNAFEKCPSLVQVDVQDANVTFSNTVFSGYPAGLTISGYQNSTAQAHAEANGIAFTAYDGGSEAPAPAAEGDVLFDENGAALMCTGMQLPANGIFGAKVVAIPGLDFETSDPAVVAVSQGHATALKTGTVTLTAKLSSDASTVTRTVRVLGGFRQLSADLLPNERVQLEWDAVPGYTPGTPKLHQAVLSSVTNVSVTSDGLVVALNPGSMVNHVRMDMGNGLYTQCDFTVYNEPSKLKLDVEDLVIAVGETAVITPSVGPFELCREYSFRSRDYTRVNVDDDGTVTGRAVGETEIIVSTYNGVEAACPVLVVPEGMSGEALKSYLGHIKDDYTRLSNMGKMFNGGYTRPDGTTVKGIALSDSALNVQKIYASTFGDSVESVVTDLIKAVYLSDLFMSSLCTQSEPSYVTVSALETALSKCSDITPVAEPIIKALEKQADISGKILINANGTKNLDSVFDSIFEHNMKHIDLRAVSVFAKWADAAEGILTAYRKSVAYQSVDRERLEEVLGALIASNDHTLQMTAGLMQTYTRDKDECLNFLIGIYGFPSSTRAALQTLFWTMEIASMGLEDLIPFVGPFLKAIDIGTGFNDLVFNIDEVNLAALNTEYVVGAANRYAETYRKAYENFISNPQSDTACWSLISASETYSRLVAAEYRAYAALPNAVNGSIAGMLQSLIEDNDWPAAVKTFEAAANQAEQIGAESVRIYGRDFLGMNS